MFVSRISDVPLVTPLSPQLALERSTPMPPPPPEREAAKPIAPDAEPGFVRDAEATAERALAAALAPATSPATYTVPGTASFGAAADTAFPPIAASDAALAAAQHEAGRAYGMATQPSAPATPAAPYPAPNA